MKKIFIILFTAFCLTLSSCGFKLRGQNSIPPQMRVLYLQSNNPYGKFEAKLRRTLHSEGVTIVDAANQAPVTLHILQTNLNYYSTNIGNSTQAAVYQVTYSVLLTIVDAKGNTLMPTRLITSTGNLTLGPNQVMSSNNQLDLVSEELQRDIINKIFDLFSSEQIADALKKQTTQPVKAKHKPAAAA